MKTFPVSSLLRCQGDTLSSRDWSLTVSIYLLKFIVLWDKYSHIISWKSKLNFFFSYHISPDHLADNLNLSNWLVVSSSIIHENFIDAGFSSCPVSFCFCCTLYLLNDCSFIIGFNLCYVESQSINFLAFCTFSKMQLWHFRLGLCRITSSFSYCQKTGKTLLLRLAKIIMQRIS